MTKNANFAKKDQLTQTSSFRRWVNNLWIDNCEERLLYNQDPATIREYWNKYKYWLKREYKHQLKSNKNEI